MIDLLEPDVPIQSYQVHLRQLPPDVILGRVPAMPSLVAVGKSMNQLHSALSEAIARHALHQGSAVRLVWETPPGQWLERMRRREPVNVAVELNPEATP
ncbi:MAG TPA: hypothetical protein VGH01_09420 [Jatrophihabitantaceae bacterium]